MKKLAIIGASYLQEPLITKAKEMGCETHVFAWAAGDVGEKIADYFYPISIVKKEEIYQKCREIGVDGVVTIATDLGAITSNYVAYKLGLTCNSPDCVLKSTNKHEMRLAFEAGGDPSPKSFCVENASDLQGTGLEYPVIVKPLDRSGSRGITKLEDETGLTDAIERAKSQGFEKKALVEEYATGREYSVECISWQGKHTLLAITEKFTTGAPNFIETGHIEPANLSQELCDEVRMKVFHALDSLGITNGASHSEIKIDATHRIRFIEIGGRMGGDFIGSDLVKLSTGIDFVEAVIKIAVGLEPNITSDGDGKIAGVRFIFTKEDVEIYKRLVRENPEIIIKSDIRDVVEENVTDSSERNGYFLIAGNDEELIRKYLPVHTEDEL